jgi:putative tricarboxylic transport membrane protein
VEIDLISIFINLIQPSTVLYLVAGVGFGIIIGAIPGLTPTMGVALLVPMTFKMDPATGLIFLGGIYTGSVYGGSIAAILLNVPGAPASIATMFDGNPMAKQGDGERALYLSVLSSGIGGIFGIILLLLFAPPLAAFSLKFGPAESFWVAIFGITIIASLSDKSIVKGLIGGSIGLVLSTVGISTISGTERFTFGAIGLIGGISLVAALIGMFALSQCLSYIEELYSSDSSKKEIYTQRKKGSLKMALKNIKESLRALSLGSAIGSIVGIVPGAGGQVASLMAYNEAKRSSKKKELFGTGHPEGLIAAESSNNAMVGGSLIPLLTLGIPGSPTAAVLLGGLLIHGLWPGPELFTTYADVSYTFIFGMLIAQLVMVVLGILGGQYFSKVLLVPQHYLVPAIIALCVIGSFATQNSYSDVLIMVALGICMFLLLKVGVSAAALILGLILGSYAEEGFLLSIRAGEAAGSVFSYLFLSPISMVMIALCILSIGSTILLQRRSSAQKTSEIVEEIKSEDATELGMKSVKKITIDRIFSIGLVIFAIVFLLISKDFPTEVAIFPRIILILTIILGFINLIFPHKIETVGNFYFNRSLIIWFAVIFGITLGFVFAIPRIGFYVSTFIFLTIIPGLVRSKQITLSQLKIKDAFVSLFFVAILYGIFTQFLGVPTPTGLFI